MSLNFGGTNIGGTSSGGGGTPYILPVASTTTLGGVKIDGTTITINDDVISSQGGGVSDHSQLSNLDYASSGHIGFAKDDLSNLTTTGKKVIDGKWVALSSTLVSNAAIPKDEDLEIDLSEILPDDNEMYELLVYAQVNALNTAGSYINLEIGTDIIQDRMSVTASRCQATGFYGTASGTVNIPVGAGRKIIVYKRSNDAGTYSLLIRGCRRIGTNI